MTAPLVLASGSETRARMLRAAGVPLVTDPGRIDEAAVRDAMQQDGASPRDVADCLAEMKAVRVSHRHAESLVLGADQVLDLDGRILSKAATGAEALDTLRLLRGRPHSLFSAAVICLNGQPVWRHIGEARLTMRVFSEDFLRDYVGRNTDAILTSVGCYRLEEVGIQLFSRIEGSYHTILGLPLPEVLDFLRIRGLLKE